MDVMQVIYYVLIGILRINEIFMLLIWLGAIFWNLSNLQAMIKEGFCFFQRVYYFSYEIFFLVFIGVLNSPLSPRYDDLHSYDPYAFLICLVVDILVIAYMILTAYMFHWLKINSFYDFYEESKYKNR